MKKLIRTSVAALAVVCCVSAAALPAMAGSTPANASTPGNAAPATSVAASSKTEEKASEAYVAPTPVTDGSYHYTTKAKANEKLNGNSFTGKRIDKTTNAIYEVYDANGNLVPATLSSDGHFYIVPTNEGYTLIGTGR